MSMQKVVPYVIVAGIAATVFVAHWREAPEAAPAAEPLEMIGSARGADSSAAGLAARITEMEARLAKTPDDASAAVVLAEALVRQARVTGNGAHAARAEQRLRRALQANGQHYDAQRMLGVVLLSLHRFDDAIVAAERARTLRPDDTFNDGVQGDALLELGRYDEAFAAFQRMMDRRPTAAAYARASYALELQGKLDAALENMRLAANATSPRDPEAMTWTTVHIGDLLFKLDRVAEAEQHYEAANRRFPNHPYALLGLARVHAQRRQDDQAIAIARGVLEKAPSVATAAFVGDLYARNGRTAEAERCYALAEAIGRDTTSDESLAGFLAERGRRVAEAVAMAEAASRRRQDIRTLDGLAWAYFKAGRLEDARSASERALRTGTRDRRIVLHAAAIRAAGGDRAAARALVRRAAAREAEFDVLAASQVAAVIAGESTVAMSLTSGAAR